MTTRTDGVADAGTVDMGAHYAVTTPEMFPLSLTVMVVDGTGAPIDPNGSPGTVVPDGGSFREFSVLELTAPQLTPIPPSPCPCLDRSV